MMERIKVPAEGLTLRAIREITARTQAGDTAIHERTQTVLEAVRTGGDAAVRKFTARFDGVELADFRVSAAEMEAARVQAGAGYGAGRRDYGGEADFGAHPVVPSRAAEFCGRAF